MKHRIQHKVAIIRNTFIFFISIYILINHKKINENTLNIHQTFIEHANLNPMQGLQNSVYHIAQYIADFIQYKNINQQRIELFLQSEDMLQEIKRLKVVNSDLIDILEPLQEMQNTFPVKYVVKLLYFISSENTRQIFFQTNENIPINSLVFNENCLIGRVFKKNGNNYYILTHQDTNFRLPVYTQNTKIFGMIHGDPYKMKFISFDEVHQYDIENDETILTASSEGKFTENISIGKIVKGKSGAFIETKCKDYYSYALIV